MDAARTVVGTTTRFYRIALLVLSLPIVLGEYFRPATGAQYDVNTLDKLVLVGQMVRNNLVLPTGSTFVEHLVVATKVLALPVDDEGVIVECGCYKGGSTANLSLAAGLCGRELAVFDSFDGMPEPDDDDSEHLLVDSERVHTYDAGAWEASYEEARTNVEMYGDLSICTFYPGLFDETLSAFDRPVALAFLDVGLRASAEDAIAELWPRLGEGCYLFTHEAKHMEIATLFFDGEWWEETLGEEPPGLVGAGSGLGLHPTPNGFSSLLAYTVKHPEERSFREVADDGVDNLAGPDIGERRARD